MRPRTVIEVVTDFLNQLNISDKKVFRLDINIRCSSKISDRASLDINLCEHTKGTEISISCSDLENSDGCPICKKEMRYDI